MGEGGLEFLPSPSQSDRWTSEPLPSRLAWLPGRCAQVSLSGLALKQTASERKCGEEARMRPHLQ